MTTKTISVRFLKWGTRTQRRKNKSWRHKNIETSLIAIYFTLSERRPSHNPTCSIAPSKLFKLSGKSLHSTRSPKSLLQVGSLGFSFTGLLDPINDVIDLLHTFSFGLVVHLVSHTVISLFTGFTQPEEFQFDEWKIIKEKETDLEHSIITCSEIHQFFSGLAPSELKVGLS